MDSNHLQLDQPHLSAVEGTQDPPPSLVHLKLVRREARILMSQGQEVDLARVI